MPSGIYCLLFSGYNSRSPAESDMEEAEIERKDSGYNSRSPAESDVQILLVYSNTNGYNSRSPAESDHSS